METDKRRLTFTNGNETYVFIYSPGDEGCLLKAMAEQAGNKGTSFSWQDAFQLVFPLMNRLYVEVAEFMKNQGLG